ncbi:ABC transporter permease [Leucobacter sp. L43]|uniref:ABC transporter permease n=1 Tax=Leucobacter sp. L43 TaxID=2798040 RepID=UPI001902D301|nr:ABC transporter permease [Leucobacter sp. L43]
MTIAAAPKRASRLRVPTALRSPLGYIGAGIVLVWLLIAATAPWLAPFDPLADDFERLQPPNDTNLMGTDAVGRDVLSRVLYGARTSLPLAFMIVVTSMIIGTIVGAVAGYFGRAVDEILMRITDIVFAFPSIILAMVIAAALGPSLTNAFIALVFVSWPSYARVARSLVIVARKHDYVIAGRMLGAGPFTSLRRDVMPNVASPLFVLGALNVGTAILELAGLSFLGLGAVPPLPDWGAAVSEGVHHFSAWWISLYPGLAILTVVVAFNLFGDSLRDSLDPSTAKQIKGGRL